jgi:hypothetical protein
MQKKLMIGFWRYILKAPPFLWEKHISKARKRFEAEYGLLSKEHRLLHHFVVRELAYVGEPLSPAYIAEKCDLPIERVEDILDELEKRMTFLFRNEDRHVLWAYPVTVEKTPHHLSFSTGEQLYAA